MLALTGKKVMWSATLDDATFTYGLRDAIKDGYLCDYEIIVPYADTNQNEFETITNVLHERPEMRHVLAYCNTIDSATKFVAHVLDRGIKTRYFDGTTPLEVREQTLDSFQKNEFRMLVTIATLNEAADIPCADTCMFVEPRGSRVRTIQNIGRVLRTHPEKTKAYVVLPVSTGDGSDTGRMLFGALGGADRLIREKGVHTSHLSFIRIVDNTPADCGDMGGETYDSLCELYNRNVFYGNFKAKVEILIEHAKTGHTPFQDEMFGIHPVGSWVSNFRSEYSRGDMSDERAAILSAIQFWAWNQRDVDWDENVKKLKQNVAENGGELAEKGECGTLIHNIRNSYAGQRGISLTPERITQIESIAPYMWWHRDHYWCRMYLYLFNHFKDALNLPVRGGGQGWEKVFRSWVSCQRDRFNGCRTPLLEDWQYAVLMMVGGWRTFVSQADDRDAKIAKIVMTGRKIADERWFPRLTEFPIGLTVMH
jgi:hypothetical protein